MERGRRTIAGFTPLIAPPLPGQLSMGIKLHAFERPASMAMRTRPMTFRTAFRTVADQSLGSGRDSKSFWRTSLHARQRHEAVMGKNGTKKSSHDRRVYSTKNGLGRPMAGAPNIFHNGLTARLLTRSLHNGTPPPGSSSAKLPESNHTILFLLWRFEL